MNFKVIFATLAFTATAVIAAPDTAMADLAARDTDMADLAAAAADAVIAELAARGIDMADFEVPNDNFHEINGRGATYGPNTKSTPNLDACMRDQQRRGINIVRADATCRAAFCKTACKKTATLYVTTCTTTCS